MKINLHKLAGEHRVSFGPENQAEKHQLAFLRDVEAKIDGVETYSWHNEDSSGIGIKILARKELE